MRTRPLSIRYIASPSSPARKSAAPAATSRVRSRSRSAAAASLSSGANSGTERSASSVISGEFGVDMVLPQPGIADFELDQGLVNEDSGGSPVTCSAFVLESAIRNSFLYAPVFHQDDSIRESLGQLAIVSYKQHRQLISRDHFAQHRQQLLRPG